MPVETIREVRVPHEVIKKVYVPRPRPVEVIKEIKVNKLYKNKEYSEIKNYFYKRILR